MIIYPNPNYARDFTLEAQEKTKDVPRWRRRLVKDGPIVEGPEPNYHESMWAYALNATLIYDPNRSPTEIFTHGPSSEAVYGLARRASGDGQVDTYSGISGYFSIFQDPEAKEGEEGKPFDALAYALEEEFREECGILKPTFEEIVFYAGEITVEPRTFIPGAMIKVAPFVGACPRMPKITMNEEISDFQWRTMPEIRDSSDLARGYWDVTLPSALAGINIGREFMNA